MNSLNIIKQYLVDLERLVHIENANGDNFKKNNEILNDVISLTCRLTIMVEFLAKVVQLEEFSLQDLYGKLVELGFKLSQEDVSGNHEKLRSDHTIIEQMCLLFSLCSVNKKDQKILTWISIIPSIPFTRKNASSWFGIQKSSTLKRLFDQGLLEIEHGNTTQKYWMHSVIAAAIREQKKDILYDETRPFIERLSEELDFGSQWGQGYKKEYLIMEIHQCRGECLMMLEQYKEAIEEYTEALRNCSEITCTTCAGYFFEGAGQKT